MCRIDACGILRLGAYKRNFNFNVTSVVTEITNLNMVKLFNFFREISEYNNIMSVSVFNVCKN